MRPSVKAVLPLGTDLFFALESKRLLLRAVGNRCLCERYRGGLATSGARWILSSHAPFKTSDMAKVLACCIFNLCFRRICDARISGDLGGSNRRCRLR